MLLCICIFFLLMHILIGGCNDILHQNKHALPVEWHPKHYKSRLAYYKLLFFAFHHTCYSITMTLLDVTLAHQHIISKADGSYWKWHTFYSNKGTMAHLFAQWKDDKVCYPNLSLELMHSYCPDTSEPQHGCQWAARCLILIYGGSDLLIALKQEKNVQQGLPGQCLFLSYQVFMMIASA